ncbi:MAG: hypothetical protein JWM34_4965 [Ilumatobacteraceae bacterium]|nr:hypothetical protein [Ilumatobacteraceae bacterium]
MSWFKKKKSVDADDMLRDIVRGGTPVSAPAAPAGMGAPAPMAPPGSMPPSMPGAPGSLAPPHQAGQPTFQFTSSGGTSSFVALGGAGGGDMSATLAKAMDAIASHGDVLRARGIDPAQIQQMLQMRMTGPGVAGQPMVFVAGQPTVLTPGQPMTSPPAAGAAPHADLVAALEDLSRLHAAGSLSDQEFAEAKTKLLAGG